jgi:hypothetical protein
MQTAYGTDFSGVRVHTDAVSQELNDSLDARAFTIGKDIAFGPGEYQPGTVIGNALIAHELAHVVQQGGTENTTKQKGESSEGALERDADKAALTAGAGLLGLARVGGAAMSRLRSGLRVQRCGSPSSKADVKGSGPSTSVIGHGASEAAVETAQERADEIFNNLKSPGEGGLKGAKIELHIIPHDKKLTDLPEFESLKGTKTFDGRDYDELRGVGGTKVGDKIRYAVAEEQLIAVEGKPSGYALGFVAGHESGHIVEQFGLTDKQKETLKAAYDARKTAGGPWLEPAWYTSSSTGEYFAQSTSAYFGHPYSTSEEDKKTYTREWLEKNDPAIYELLKSIYK